MRFLTALPVFNEEDHLDEVLTQVKRYAGDILVIDDGSTDATPRLLRENHPEVRVIRHPTNLGYGAGLRDAFHETVERGYDALVTIDCDGQHQPCRIPQMAAATADCDIASGSRYLKAFDTNSIPPEERRTINVQITQELNRRLGLSLTDAFCGFKGYRADCLAKFDITDIGYAMPLQVWVQAVYFGMRIKEVAIPLVYLEEERSFGGSLDKAQVRLAYYRKVLDQEIRRWGLDDRPPAPRADRNLQPELVAAHGVLDRGCE